MDRAYSVLRFALLQVLMSAVCASPCPEGVSVHCPNKTGPVGEALRLSCQVTCDTTVLEKGVNTSCHKWSKNETEIIKFSNCSSVIINYTFYHTIENLSAEHYGTYKFWIQMHNGYCAKYFTVNQGPSVPATASVSGPSVPASACVSEPSVLETASVSELINEETKTHLGVWFTMAFLAIVVIAVVLYTKRKETFHLFQIDLPHSQATLLGTPC